MTPKNNTLDFSGTESYKNDTGEKVKEGVSNDFVLVHPLINAEPLTFYKNMAMKTGRSIVSLSFLRSLVYIKYLLLICSEYFLQNSSNDLCV